MICYFKFSAFNPFSYLFMKEFQRIKKSIKSGESKEESGKVIWTNPENGQIIEDIESISFIEKGSHSFKESYGLKEFISHIQSQFTVLDVLLVQVKTIVFYYFNI